jgi:hypothetical protein
MYLETLDQMTDDLLVAEAEKQSYRLAEMPASCFSERRAIREAVRMIRWTASVRSAAAHTRVEAACDAGRARGEREAAQRQRTKPLAPRTP